MARAAKCATTRCDCARGEYSETSGVGRGADSNALKGRTLRYEPTEQGIRLMLPRAVLWLCTAHCFAY